MSLIRYQRPEVSTWAPFDRLSTLRDEMNQLFDLTVPGFTQDAGLFTGWNPVLDLYQDKDNVLVKVELPGMKKEELDIAVHDGILTIGGERKREEETGEGESYRSERFFGRFHRSVSLPTSVDSSKAKASYQEGVLTITLPKAEEAKPKQIKVDVA